MTVNTEHTLTCGESKSEKVVMFAPTDRFDLKNLPKFQKKQKVPKQFSAMQISFG